MARNTVRTAFHEPGLWKLVPRPMRPSGLRKAGATIAAERGASERQLMAIFGWQTSKQAVLYTRAAEQKVLAGGAMTLLSIEQK